VEPRSSTAPVTPPFLTSIYDEIRNTLSAAGMEPTSGDTTQLLRSIQLVAAQQIPPGIRTAATSVGAFPGPELLGTFEQIAHYEGSWGCGNLGGGLPPEPYYEEAPGEIYNAPGPQTLVGGFGVRALDARMADMGIWLPRERFVPGDVLWIRAYGRIRQGDAASARTFYYCLDPNGHVGAKQNPWGSGDAIVLACNVPANQFPQRVPAIWDVVLVYVATADQILYSQLSVPTKSQISGKRFQGGPGFLQTWGIDFFGNGWNFLAPPVVAGHANWLGNTLLGTRWAVSGTQNNLATLSLHTLDAYVSRNRFV
jgi:hypothetical protein